MRQAIPLRGEPPTALLPAGLPQPDYWSPVLSCSVSSHQILRQAVPDLSGKELSTLSVARKK